jgi:LPS O-antigen subunit length determinant protein (WzzB/FepE family)
LGYIYIIPKEYSNLLTLSTNINEKSKFFRFVESEKLIEIGKDIQINQKILNKFYNEFKDYEEFLINLKNSKNVRENISMLPIKDQKKVLMEYKKILEIDKKINEKTIITLNLKWNNIEEARDILQDTINLTFNNFINSIFFEMYETLDNRKKENDEKKSIKIKFLKEQIWIAKEIQVSDPINGYTGTPYYLRGHKAIAKEIELIENSTNQEFEFIKKKIDFFKKENIDWIDYDINSIKVVSLKKSKLILIMSILLGLVLGAFYTLISNAIKSKSVSKKKY